MSCAEALSARLMSAASRVANSCASASLIDAGCSYRTCVSSRLRGQELQAHNDSERRWASDQPPSRNGVALDWECGTRTRRCARSCLAGEGGMPCHGTQLAGGCVSGRRTRAELIRDRRLLTVARQPLRPAVTTTRLVPRIVPWRIDGLSKFKSINVTEMQEREPPVGIEPTTCSLRETRSPAPDALAAPIARPNAPIAHDAPDARPARSTTRSTVRPPTRPDSVTVGSQMSAADRRGPADARRGTSRADRRIRAASGHGIPATRHCRCACSGAARTGPSTWAARSCGAGCTRPCCARRPGPRT